MKKIQTEKLESINGGLNCFVTGLLTAGAIATTIGSANPFYGYAALGVLAPHIRDCWNS